MPRALSHRRTFYDEVSDDLVKRFRLFAVIEMAGAVDDVHFRLRIVIGDQLEGRVAGL